MGKINLNHNSELRAVSALRFNPRNAAIHPEDQLLSMAAAYKKFGFIGAVIVGSENTVLAGEGRVRAAKIAGMKEIPVIDVSHLTAEEQRAYVISDNKLSEMKLWDENMLQTEIEELCELDFTLTELGLESLEGIEEEEDEEEEPEPAKKPKNDKDTPRCSECGQKLIAGRG